VEFRKEIVTGDRTAPAEPRPWGRGVTGAAPWRSRLCL